ncbi:MAG: hypothetical protein I3I94_09040 [Acidaminococcaceae bacterium]|nr:hypothetical protein [Acidaminococcaceae bacterium]
MNDKNLDKGKFTKENAREKGRKGGLKTAENKRKRKTMAEQVQAAMNAPVANKRMQAKLEAAGLDPTYGGVMVIQLLANAGRNPAIARLLLQLIGEDPYLKLDKETLDLKREALLGKQKDKDDAPVIIVGEEDIPE